jgi:sterol desaturase/sphingolipid hydroxylase (fatty acid hydroxylase superfamily)
MNEHALGVLQQMYWVMTLGTFIFLVVMEGGVLDARAPRQRLRHILRNLGLLACVLAIVETVSLGQGFSIGSALTRSSGLLTPFALAVWAQFAIGFLLIDLFEYSFHRAAHRWRWLWLFHAVHHSDTELDTSTGVRFHPLESAIDQSLIIALLLTLGLPLWVLLARAIAQNPIDFALHANLRFPAWVENRVGWLLVTPRMHRVHHSPVLAETNSNYGVMLSIWDRIFGTYTAPVGERPARYGLSKLGDDSWQSFEGMLFTPLRARRLGTL